MLRNEWLKIRTTRSPWLLLGVAQLLVLVGVGGLALNRDLTRPGVATAAIGHAGLVSLLALMLGIVAVAGEYRHKTITDTYLATPRRSRVVLAKLAVYTVAGFAFGVASVATAIVASAVGFALRDASLDLGSAAVWRTVVGCVLWNGAFAAIGVGVGALVRNLAGAVAAALAWLALVEGLVGQLFVDLRQWLPFASGSALADLPTAADSPSQAVAGLVLAGYAALFTLLAVSTVRRDVH
jgi:ABC-2 type transport system permease protein